ncbi:MAG TPA: hypothetical protein VFN89_02490 [Solirubrobacterales bacterium]|nr:hypothetical protein [Solirubrobacterales bacterium]
MLLTDAQERSAPAACEALSRSGYRVGAAGSDRPAPGQWSRHCDERVHVPDPRDDSRAFAAAVAETAAGHGFDTVMPGSDAAVLALSTHRDLFPPQVALGLPSPEVVDVCLSKACLAEHASAVGLAAPGTVACENRAQALAAAAELGFPVLVKHRGTAVRGDGGIRQRGSVIALDEEGLRHVLADFGLPCLLQRRVTGAVHSVGGVVAEGRLLGVATSRYVRTWPAAAGSVSFSVSLRLAPALALKVERFIAAVRWQGIFELELIEVDAGEFAAIDFNPRLYGSLALAVDAGAPLPTIWCDWLLAGRAASCEARSGAYYRWSDADLRHAAAHLRSGRFAAALRVARPRRGTSHPYHRRRDPAPAIARALQILRHRLPRWLGGVPSPSPMESDGARA